MLASTSLGSVSGFVFVDIDGNGTLDPGEELSGAAVQLWEDTNSNGMFEDTIDDFVTTRTTDDTGQYQFLNLLSGDYFAVQPPQLVSGATLDEQVSPLLSIDGAGVSTQLIDDFFSDSGPVVDASPTGSPETMGFAATNAIADIRKLTAEFLSGPAGQTVAIRTDMQTLLVNPDIGSIGKYTVTWDGSLGAFDPTGLGGIDLMANDGVGFCLNEVMVDQPGGSLTVRVYSSATEFSEATIESLTPLVDQGYFLSFSDADGDAQFAPAGGGGADFTNVGAIQLELTASSVAMDGLVSNLDVLGLDNQAADFANEPPTPEIDVEKLTNGNQADNATDADVPIVAPGSTVVWTYQVSNPGTVNMTTVSLIDNQIGPITNLISGDNGNLILEPGEVWIYQAMGTAIQGTYSNEAMVTGSAAGTASATDTDTSHYRGAVAAIDIEKLTNGNQADDPTDADVPQVLVGSTVTWTYRVTNTGSLDLSNVEVVDDVIGNITNIVDQGDGDDLLVPGEMWTLQATGIAQAGPYENEGTVTAVGENQQPVTDQDSSHYVGGFAGINLEKLTNGMDADAPGTGPTVVVGESVTFTYLVTNTGDFALSNVQVEDDNGTPGDSTDDFFATFVGGDSNDNDQLDIPETWEFQATRVATEGEYENIAVATGDGPPGNLVSDQDPSHHTGIERQPVLSKRFFLASAFG